MNAYILSIYHDHHYHLLIIIIAFMLNFLELVLMGLIELFQKPSGSQPIELHFLSYIRQVLSCMSFDYLSNYLQSITCDITCIKGKYIF